MTHLVSNTTGLIHLITSILSLVFGTLVLLTPKGTARHKKKGYIYVVAMVVMLLTSFFMYNLYGRFGVFHYFSVVSTVTLLGGIIPAWSRKPEQTWRVWHFSFMYWSVMGLYAAFVAELLTRIPQTPFYNMVGVAIFIVMSFAYYFWYKNKKVWEKQFGGQ